MATQAFETAKDVEQPEDVPIVSSTKEKQNYGSKANSHDDGLMSKNKMLKKNTNCFQIHLMVATLALM